jgi:hypothetical protein
MNVVVTVTYEPGDEPPSQSPGELALAVLEALGGGAETDYCNLTQIAQTEAGIPLPQRQVEQEAAA